MIDEKEKEKNECLNWSDAPSTINGRNQDKTEISSDSSKVGRNVSQTEIASETCWMHWECCFRTNLISHFFSCHYKTAYNYFNSYYFKA